MRRAICVGSRVQLVLMVAVLAVSLGCRAEKTPVKAVVVNPGFLKLASLRHAPDETHNVPVTLPDGETCYREAAPGLTLKHIVLDRTAVTEWMEPGTWAVAIRIEDSHFESSFREWWQSRHGGLIGVELRRRIVFSTTVEVPAGHWLYLTWVKTRAEADQLAEAIRAGGTFDTPGK